MNISIKNYKNIESLSLEIEEGKNNYIYGISGSGKSTIAGAIIGDISDNTIPYGKQREDLEIEIQPTVTEEEFSLFNESSYQNLLINRTDNPNMYSIIFSNDGTLTNIRSNISMLLSDFNSNREKFNNYINKVNEMIKLVNKRKLPSSGKFSSSSSLEKLKLEAQNPKYSKYSKFIHDYGLDYVEWIKKGTSFSFYESSKCPFCQRKLTLSRNEKIKDIINITPDQYELITNSKDVFLSIGIDIPNFSYKREINKLEKDLYEAVKNMNYISDMLIMIDSYNNSNLDMNKINKIKIPSKLKELYPELIDLEKNFNDNIKELKTQYGKVKLKTSKIIGQNLKILNDNLSLLSIPYEFEVESFDGVNKTANVFLKSISDRTLKDRVENLSFGEKNLVALLLFLVSNKKSIVIIDDPASSYDDNRRKLIYELLYEFKKNNTFIILSHDQVFVKYAIMGIEDAKNKKYIDNTGKIVYIENHLGKCMVKDIEINDFSSIREHVMKFIQSNELSYYRKIINLRILAETDRSNRTKDKTIYSYLSGILHTKNRDSVLDLLNEKGIDESVVIGYIKDQYGIELEKMPTNIMEDFNYDELENFEKIAYKREEMRKRNGHKTAIEKEYDDIIHLNTNYFISLNPYKFDIFPNHIYKFIENE